MRISALAPGLALAPLAVMIPAVPAAAQGGDAAKGKAVFARCAACHTMQPGVNRIGPSLAGIVGRKAATVPGFNYSPAMKKAALSWDARTLDAFLAKPMTRVPGNRMVFAGLPNPADRANLIAYLRAAK